MKIIEFPTTNKKIGTPEAITPNSDLGEPADIIDLCEIHEALKNLDEEELGPEADDLFATNDLVFFEKIIKAAEQICANEQDMAAAICALVSELEKKISPLKEKFFLPEKIFFKMVGNKHFESRFTRMLNSFPAMESYKDLSLSQIGVMLDKNWPFKADQKVIIDFLLHLLGAVKSLDLLKLKAYISSTDWDVAVTLLKEEEL